MGPRKQRAKKSQTADQSLDSRAETQSTENQQTEPSVSGIAVNGPPDVPVTGLKEKVTVTIDANGGLDLDSMRDKTRERLVAAIKASREGLFPMAPAAQVKRWPDFAVRGLYGILGAAETAAAAKKYPMEIAQAVFMYSDQEIEVLMEPTQAVLAKHAGRLDRWQEEVALSLVLVQVHFAKLHNLHSIMARYVAVKAAEEKPAPGPKPSDTQVPPVPDMSGELQ